MLVPLHKCKAALAIESDKNEGKGHRDVQIRCNQNSLLLSHRACKTSLPPCHPPCQAETTHPVAVCAQGLGRASPSREKVTSHGLSVTTEPVMYDSDDAKSPHTALG